MITPIEEKMEYIKLLHNLFGDYTLSLKRGNLIVYSPTKGPLYTIPISDKKIFGFEKPSDYKEECEIYKVFKDAYGEVVYFCWG